MGVGIPPDDMGDISGIGDMGDIAISGPGLVILVLVLVLVLILLNSMYSNLWATCVVCYSSCSGWVLCFLFPFLEDCLLILSIRVL